MVPPCHAIRELAAVLGMLILKLIRYITNHVHTLAKLFPPILGGGFQAGRQQEAARNNILPTTTTPREDHQARDGHVMNRVA
jgi:hypothetical protein